jgi:hypothetical protein
MRTNQALIRRFYNGMSMSEDGSIGEEDTPRDVLECLWTKESDFIGKTFSEAMSAMFKKMQSDILKSHKYPPDWFCDFCAKHGLRVGGHLFASACLIEAHEEVYG